MNSTAKLILFDVDGTLLDRHNRIPPSAKQAVMALKNAGHTVALASGRSPFMLEQVRQELQLDSYVSFNGQYVAHQGTLIHSNPINPEAIHKLSAFAAIQEHALVFLDHAQMSCSQTYHPHVDLCLKSLGVTHPSHHASFCEDRAIYQTMLFCTVEEEASYREQFEMLNFVRWHPLSMDVLPAGGSKAEGIIQLVARLGFQPEDIYAFGDNYNDIEMFQYVGCGIAMGNAPEALKQLASHVTLSAEQEGIWHGLQWTGLI
ncbi:Cof-type HAD-IIB family hydrolase [Paenibacillus sp. MER 99-2]|uniref:Cof-type HAD-IIB family hydrolase n=1 Tax=Paenibacillus sp. MER 99-2 TaxID=2939572 RepID=UPI00203B068C|nr:Cof-type HAD-IIB family hydrolase [Paenibacillus sp. MER 99-2]MCM3174556.1 Cof-type HAD-IIB family hydrolase [Paenibacillus sp. MER 99-2]